MRAWVCPKMSVTVLRENETEGKRRDSAGQLIPCQDKDSSKVVKTETSVKMIQPRSKMFPKVLCFSAHFALLCQLTKNGEPHFVR